jgi:hypothetical protein
MKFIIVMGKSKILVHLLNQGMAAVTVMKAIWIFEKMTGQTFF